MISRTFRICAFILDIVFLLVLGLCSPLIRDLFYLLQKWIPIVEIPQKEEYIFLGMLGLVILFEAMTGLTAGKALMKIIPSTQQGKQGNTQFYILRALLRYSIVWLIFLIELFEKSLTNSLSVLMILVLSMLYLLSNLILFLGKEKSALHDRIIKGKVIEQNALLRIHP